MFVLFYSCYSLIKYLPQFSSTSNHSHSTPFLFIAAFRHQNLSEYLVAAVAYITTSGVLPESNELLSINKAHCCTQILSNSCISL